MSKYLLGLAICLLAAVLAFAQASQPSPPSPQQSPQRQSQTQDQSQPQPEPAQPPHAGPGSESDRSAASGGVGQTNPAATNGQPGQPPSQPRSGGGIGWGWIIVAIVVGVVVIGLLSRGGSERVEHIERSERDRDDIRKAG